MQHENDEKKPVVLWFRNDLRLDDNLALQAATGSKSPVICVYIREDEAPFAGALGAAQAWWLHHSLSALDTSLQKSGNRLVLLSGKAIEVLETLVERTGASAVFWNRRYDSGGIACDTAVKSRLRERGIEAKSFAGFLMHEPMKVLTKQGNPYSVFTPFWKAFESQFQPHDVLPAPKKILAPHRFPSGEMLADWQLLPTKPDWAKGFSESWEPGEHGAHVRLSAFLKTRLDGYKTGRDFPARETTSGLSPHLAMGEISPHRIWNETQTAFGSADHDDVVHFRREVVWREFSWHLLFHKPDMPTVNLDRRFDAFAWVSDAERLRAWQHGKTGYPIVDAGMRELWQTGYMHNRIRMVVASFLIKDLLIDWRDGEKWFRETLVDIDCASNAMNWQWVAGCGADASPWFRIFNPVKQGETFDPDGVYVRRYCPELADLPDKFIHKPFEAPKTVLDGAGVTLGETYPDRLVAHDVARDKALAAFRALQQSDA